MLNILSINISYASEGVKTTMFQEEKVLALTHFGRTPLQAKVYLAFLDHGESSAGMAAKNSGIARQEVYRIINELLDHGLLRLIIAKPTRYEPISLEVAITLFLNEKRKRIGELESSAVELMKRDSQNNGKTKSILSKDYKFEIMEEHDRYYKSVNFFAGLKNYDLINSSRRYAQVMLASDDVEDALKTGTRMRVILNKPECSDPLFKKLLTFKKKLSSL
jgi:sugar-specific transcriptional regulator TrmB